MNRFSKNYYKLRYSKRHRSFMFPNMSCHRQFQKELKKCLKNARRIIIDEDCFLCNDKTSRMFYQSDFWKNIFTSVSNYNGKNGLPLIVKESDIIRNMKRLKKVDIDYDAFRHDMILYYLTKSEPDKRTDENTPVSYVFHTDLKDEMYFYSLYIKLYINERNNDVIVQAIHWNDRKESHRVKPMRIYNHQTKSFDSFDKCSEWLKKKVSNL